MVRGCKSAWCERADMADGVGVDREGLGGSKHARVTGWHVEIDSGLWVQWGGWWLYDIDRAIAGRLHCAWTMFVMPSLPMARASVAAGRWWT